MITTVNSLINCPEQYKLCDSCGKINSWFNYFCVTCGHEISERQKPLRDKDIAGFVAIVGEEGNNITIEV